MKDQVVENVLQNHDAEQDIIAALIVNNQNLDITSNYISYHHFAFDLHQKIYKITQDLINKGSVADVTNISHKLAGDEGFEAQGGKGYLNKLLLRVADLIPLKERCMIVKELYTKRNLIDLAGKIKDGSALKTAEEIASETEKRIFDLRNETGGVSNSPQKIGTFLQNIIAIADKARHSNILSGLPTGFVDVDEIISGFNPSDLLILAARPSMGKTALAVNMAYNVAVYEHSRGNGGGVALFSLEMSSDQIATRILSMISGVSSVAIRTGKYSKFDSEADTAGHKMSEQDFAKLQDAALSLNEIPLFIDDTPAISTSLLRTKCRMLKQMHNISAVFIDYLQLMRGSESASANNRVLEISEISQTLKAIAKELNIPVIALSQLSRQVEARDDKHPQLSDLRESGSIEQDADIVMFLYREEYYLEKTKPKPPSDPSDVQAKDTKDYQAWIDKMYGKPMKNLDGTFVIDNYTGDVKLVGGAQNVAEVIIAKHRNGPTGSVKLFFDKSRTAFHDLKN
ncbi:replicative DNA helicase [Candidatus Deianiraea vastatrix]|uniref:Replicative DNA helicase n=1 Tax=Candidatus Deianiraea vastatrix TaxID=2163644 RepID=A0A5B8XEX6_9RICK|nr:replicative DNA helicase [Candidatus Deianiraea vastatrix]QED23526.1 Replicative DNA helicase [Candidatus Deianiraea vastatrix]